MVFAYVALDLGGFGYTAFVVDAYAGLIPGWECSMPKDTGFVERALRQAASFRARQGYPFNDTIHLATPEVSTPQYITAKR